MRIFLHTTQYALAGSLSQCCNVPVTPVIPTKRLKQASVRPKYNMKQWFLSFELNQVAKQGLFG